MWHLTHYMMSIYIVITFLKIFAPKGFYVMTEQTNVRTNSECWPILKWSKKFHRNQGSRLIFDLICFEQIWQTWHLAYSDSCWAYAWTYGAWIHESDLWKHLCNGQADNVQQSWRDCCYSSSLPFSEWWSHPVSFQFWRESKGRNWVEQYHPHKQVNWKRFMALYCWQTDIYPTLEKVALPPIW